MMNNIKDSEQKYGAGQIPLGEAFYLHEVRPLMAALRNNGIESSLRVDSSAGKPNDPIYIVTVAETDIASGMLIKKSILGLKAGRVRRGIFDGRGWRKALVAGAFGFMAGIRIHTGHPILSAGAGIVLAALCFAAALFFL